MCFSETESFSPELSEESSFLRGVFFGDWIDKEGILFSILGVVENVLDENL